VTVDVALRCRLRHSCYCAPSSLVERERLNKPNYETLNFWKPEEKVDGVTIDTTFRVGGGGGKFSFPGDACSLWYWLSPARRTTRASSVSDVTVTS
jgi:hypothetical protein